MTFNGQVEKAGIEQKSATGTFEEFGPTGFSGNWPRGPYPAGTTKMSCIYYYVNITKYPAGSCINVNWTRWQPVVLNFDSPFYRLNTSTPWNQANTKWETNQRPVNHDSVITKIEVKINVDDLPQNIKPGGDVGVFIYKPGFYPPGGTFSQVIVKTGSFIWSGSEDLPNVFVPAGSIIYCGSSLWTMEGIFPETFGNFHCSVTIEDPSNKKVTKVLRIPYLDQLTNPALANPPTSGKSPWVGYVSTTTFPLKVKSAALFINFPTFKRTEFDFCFYWIKRGNIYQSKCIPRQVKEAYKKFEGYKGLFELNWDLPPGDKFYAQCAYYGDPGTNGDCAAFVYVELPENLKNLRGVFTSNGLINPEEARQYCNDPFNLQTFTHPMYKNNPQKCIELLRL
jgi:hypothetical protein